jgi:hypothetical protein
MEVLGTIQKLSQKSGMGFFLFLEFCQFILILVMKIWHVNMN